MINCSLPEKDFAVVILPHRLDAAGEKLCLNASEKQKQELEALYEIPKVIELQAHLTLLPGDLITLSGELKGRLKRVCCVTAELFEEAFSAPFRIFLSEHPEQILKSTGPDIDLKTEEIDEIKNGRIYLKPLLFEQFGLNLNPYPKKTTELFYYTDPNDLNEKNNPFEVLKMLTKK